MRDENHRLTPTSSGNSTAAISAKVQSAIKRLMIENTSSATSPKVSGTGMSAQVEKVTSLSATASSWPVGRLRCSESGIASTRSAT